MQRAEAEGAGEVTEVVRRSMGCCLEILVATVSGDKLDDGACIVGAVLEHYALKQIRAMAQDQESDELVDERLRDLDLCEIERLSGNSRVKNKHEIY